MTASRAFRRDYEALEDLFSFTSDAFGEQGIDERLRPTVDFVLEELFTNVVKYGGNTGPAVRVELAPTPGGVEVTVIEDDAERFDPTAGPAVDVTKPLEARGPGGLGLHLIRKLVDSIEYRYVEASRQGRTTFRKTSRSLGQEGE
jgi:anti-sigma regulatory factor (Ser/Thr protein kinase)